MSYTHFHDHQELTEDDLDFMKKLVGRPQIYDASSIIKRHYHLKKKGLIHFGEGCLWTITEKGMEIIKGEDQ